MTAPDASARPAAQAAARARTLATEHVHLWRTCYTQLIQRNVLTMSAALCYRTIFALVPLLLLALLGLKSMGMANQGRQYLDRFLTETGLSEISTADAPDADTHAQTPAPADPERHHPASTPASGSRPAGPHRPLDVAGLMNAANIIRKQIDTIDRQLTFGALGPIGAVLLVWTALSLLVSVEGFLNRVFDAPKGRSWQKRILVYWAVVTLGPLLLSTVGYMGSRAVAAASGLPWLAPLAKAAAWATPAAIGVFVLAAIYTWMPHVPVRFRAAVYGAAATVVCWLVAMAGFSFYVNRVIAHKSLYGAMGALPLFLLWVYLSWAVFLLGAQLAAILNNPRAYNPKLTAPDQPATPWTLLAAALAVAHSYHSPTPPASTDTLADLAGLSPASAQPLLDRLASAGIILATAPADPLAAPAYVLAHAPQQLRLLDILGLSASPGASPAPSPSDPAIASALSIAQSAASKALGNLTLADVLPPASKPAPSSSL